MEDSLVVVQPSYVQESGGCSAVLLVGILFICGMFRLFCEVAPFKYSGCRPSGAPLGLHAEFSRCQQGLNFLSVF